ncbi:MAG: transcriptional regulator [Coriobacteriaceae bacterium]|jgi:ArsR family transcriptional regulator|nr:metalloregulator ArsR/SmtB family transcription factor [Olsenella sp.]MCI1289348.1 metalloregulator ArsR/SmtB family transcription factor [Olsenella sp.]RRF89046.1 MAG: transcriptional regulator [Coriobacteriaceae bacterium]
MEDWCTAAANDSALEELLANDDVVYSATQIFDALSDFTRFQILAALVLGEKSVSDLQEVCHVSQSAISHQLRLLRDRGLVNARRDGQRMIYTLADEHVAQLLRVGLAHAAEDVLPE